MLPTIDKPVVQYVVEEAISAGIEDVIMVTGSNKRAIEDHFDNSYELEKRLVDFGKEQLIEEIRKPASLANFIYVRQKGPCGNAIPVKSCKHLVSDEPFLVLWGDEFFLSKGKTRSQQAVEAYEKYQATILCAFVSKNEEDTRKYGFVDGVEVKPGVWKVNRLIENPDPENNLQILLSFRYTFLLLIFSLFWNLSNRGLGESIIWQKLLINWHNQENLFML